MLLAFVYLKGTQKALKYSNDTRGEFKGYLDTPRALHVQLDTQGTWALEPLKYVDTRSATEALGQLGTRRSLETLESFF